MTEETKATRNAAKKAAVAATAKNILDTARANTAAKKAAKAVQQEAAAESKAAGNKPAEIKNDKARQYIDFLTANKITCFAAGTPVDRPDAVVFRSFLTVENEDLPMWIEMDDSIFVMIYVRLSTKSVNKKKRSEILEYFNDMNSRFKVFKYTTNSRGESLLMSCIPVAPDGFKPELVNGILDVILKHLEETYAGFMCRVWSD